MTPQQQRLVDNLRAAIEKQKDPKSRRKLLDKLASVERHLEDEPRLRREAAEAEALVANRKRAVYRTLFAASLAVIALVGAIVWFAHLV